jgi:hypothetical protein
MAMAYVCDFCGKQIGVSGYRRNQIVVDPSVSPYDLCDECVSVVRTFCFERVRFGEAIVKVGE